MADDILENNAVTVFLDENQMDIKETVIENEEFNAVTWDSPIVRKLTQENLNEQQEKFHQKVKISSYFKKYEARGPGSGDVRIGKPMTFRTDMYSLLFVTSLRDEFK